MAREPAPGPRSLTSERRLLLLRHARAVAAQEDASDASDRSRTLSPSGRLDADALGALLRQRALAPEQALVSPALRTRETFELLRPFAPTEPCAAFHDALYLAAPSTLLAMLRGQDCAPGSLMLVGHNPGLHELALMLSGGHELLQDGFPTCTLAMFGFDGAWSELAPRRARLLEVLRP